MIKNSPFTIYNASAGSGKTFTLVKEYLKLILQASTPDYYKHLLAITFTNKAVAEMKQRIVDHLRLFSEEETLVNPPPMLEQIAEECALSKKQIQLKSKAALHHLLHHYAAFSVETIDGFNHRLIRTFAKDLKIASNFEVTLEQQQLLDRAVDRLISKAGEDQNITKVLVDFTLKKTDDDRSWDISRDIASAAKILFVENDIPYVSLLKEKKLSDFNALSERLQEKLQAITKSLDQLVNTTLQLIEEAGLQHTDFIRSSFPKYLQNILVRKFDKYNTQWQTDIDSKPFYTQATLKKSPDIAAVMDELAPAFATAFIESKTLVFQYKLFENILNNLTPLSVINLVQQEIDLIKEEDNVLPIAEFNRIINKEIKDQPAPFIYERLGERYRHFFIDEFQDTSKLQWENLLPLADNALSQEFQDEVTGSLLIVGDAKQAIYRWRGGLPSQFIALYNDTNPFSVADKSVEQLAVNWRSSEEIVNFNNSFFTHIAKYFDNPLHQALYHDGNRQLLNAKQNGYVQLQFVEGDDKEALHSAYAEEVLKVVAELKEDGYRFRDICILTRTKKDGIAIGEVLMREEIPVVSSETLLIQHSDLVQFLVNCLHYREHPDSDEVKVNLLLKLHDLLNIPEDKGVFLSSFFPSEETNFIEKLTNYGVELSFDTLVSLSLYEACEYCIALFKLSEKADAYLDGFLNVVFDFQQQFLAEKESFLEYWDEQKDSAAITTGDGLDAIRLMTIHKVKGLEFPVVLFPYADVKIYQEKFAKTWYNAAEFSEEFQYVLLNYKEELSNYSDQGKMLVEERRKMLELDNLNLLYVALTRAVERLYIFSELISASQDKTPASFNQFFINYLEDLGRWDPTQLSYEFGLRTAPLEVIESEENQTITPGFLSSDPQEHNLIVASRDAALWFSEAEIAIAAGTLLHNVMEEIVTFDDVENALAQQYESLNSEEQFRLKKMVENITSHPELKPYYSGNDRIENERDIVTVDGILLRPDRLNFHADGSVTVIDYKTGAQNDSYLAQINGYADALKEMGFSIKNKLIIYAAEGGVLINKI